MSKAVRALAQTVHPNCIVVYTTTGFTALTVAAERIKVPVVALTTEPQIYHALNLVWGIRPLLVKETAETFEGLVTLAASTLQRRGLAAAGDKILVLGGIPAGEPQGANFLKIHVLN
jgi:pyruvate kinase